MKCKCVDAWTKPGKHEAHYMMLLKMQELRKEAAKLAATPGCFGEAKKLAKEFEETEAALMYCLKTQGSYT